MFVFRSIFWLGVVVMLLPPAPDGTTPAPRVGVLEALAAARTFAHDLSQACDRNPHACTVGSDTLTLVKRKAETGIDIFGALIGAGDETPEAGTLTARDLTAEWSAPAGD
jgi:hypothetical protein